METGEILSLVGILLVFAAGQTATTRYLLGRIRESDRDRAAATGELHKRIDDTRDQYVRRDDLMAHVGRIESSLERLHTRLDAVIDGKAKKGGQS